jgi:hypothetical protein
MAMEQLVWWELPGGNNLSCVVLPAIPMADKRFTVGQASFSGMIESYLQKSSVPWSEFLLVIRNSRLIRLFSSFFFSDIFQSD